MVRCPYCLPCDSACLTHTPFSRGWWPHFIRSPPAVSLFFPGELFSQTYRAEFRVERAGREKQIVGFDPARYAELLPLAWAEGGVAFTDEDGRLTPDLTPDDRRRLLGQWRWRRRLGRPLNIARLIKAAFTFEGAARYAAWKIERHTGMVVPLTPWREKHPVLASPGVLWRLWRRRVQRETD